jgi:hypothetical protein
VPENVPKLATKKKIFGVFSNYFSKSGKKNVDIRKTNKKVFHATLSNFINKDLIEMKIKI